MIAAERLQRYLAKPDTRCINQAATAIAAAMHDEIRQLIVAELARQATDDDLQDRSRLSELVADVAQQCAQQIGVKWGAP